MEIQQVLQDSEHVKELAQSIKAVGLTEPIWVRDGDYLVIEGNSRLAAYRLLSKSDPVKWGTVKCYLFPKNLDDKEIFTFLCVTHIVSRKDWAPYEQAGIIWRRWKQHNANPESLSKELGIPQTRIEHLIEVYSFMDEHNDREVQRWSFYDEYLKSRKIGKRRKENPELDSLVVHKIQSGDIPKAENIRDQLAKIAGTPGKTFQWFVSDQKSLQECYDLMEAKGDNNTLYNLLYKFRIKVSDLAARESIKRLDGPIQDKCEFELKKIQKSIDRLLKALESRNTK
jgi:hypothetical protein